MVHPNRGQAGVLNPEPPEEFRRSASRDAQPRPLAESVIGLYWRRAIEFEWDPAKDHANRDKHGLSFDEAVELFSSGVDYLEIYDGGHDAEEDRFIAIGPVRRGVIVVIYSERNEDTIRLISARIASKAEVRLLRTYIEVHRER